MEIRYASIPTQYQGVQFRSRLEARWAAFFDLLEWKWEYEPIDLNGWIPDFKIQGERDLLVEVKPFDISKLSWDDASRYITNDIPEDELSQEWLPALKKIVKAHPDIDTLLLGNGVYHHDETYDLGLVIYKDLEWATTVSIADSIPPVIVQNTMPAYVKAVDVWALPKRAMFDYTLLSQEKVMDFWKQAGNRTQWKGARQVT